MADPSFTGFPPDWPSWVSSASYPPQPAGWQCVVWAAWRYHQLTGNYPLFDAPANGGPANAVGWTAEAQKMKGWTVASTPVVPSIMCLQPGVDGAAYDGHVCIVENFNVTGLGGGTLQGQALTSNMNWGVPNGSSSKVEMVLHNWPQKGMAFLYLTGTGTGGTGNQGTGSFSFTGGSPNPLMALAPNADVTLILWAIDQALTITNPFDVQNVPDVSVPIPVIGGSFDTGVANPITWASDVGTNIINDFDAFVIRAMFVILGSIVILKVLGNFIDFSAVGQAAGQIGSLAALAVA
jgi:hypothetical protein